MYLEHFGLSEPPFKITPVTEFFFSGANRGEILDALIYAITNSEGIIKVTGEVGSGKTMLCRMLLDRLPTNIKAIYLANPSLTREELIYAIADGFELNVENQRISILMQNLHNHLVGKYNQGERCVVLVDEAHAMPPETLEELRLLYNLQLGKQKLVQIVLFGQPELNRILEHASMRQLKDRIVHSFNIQPISKKTIENYLMFRMRAAGYHGPDVFSHAAITLISKASNGLLRRVNILADKSLLAAFVENTHRIEQRHVIAAIRDTELVPENTWGDRKKIALISAAFASALLLAGLSWMLGKKEGAQDAAVTVSVAASQPIATSTPAAPPATSSSKPTEVVAQTAPVVVAAPPKLVSNPVPAALNADVIAKIQALRKKLPTSPPLLRQRLDATQQMLGTTSKNSLSVLLFYTTDARPERMEGFLGRAKSLGLLSEIYIMPTAVHDKPAYRAIYGIYQDRAAADAGINSLPKRYQKAFSLSIDTLDSYFP